jgi:hypothetical protein
LFGFTLTAIIGLGTLGTSARLNRSYQDNIAKSVYDG